MRVDEVAGRRRAERHELVEATRQCAPLALVAAGVWGGTAGARQRSGQLEKRSILQLECARVLLEAAPSQSRLPRHRLLLGSRRPRLRDQRHGVEVAVHALGEADLVAQKRGNGRSMARCRGSPWVRAQACEEVVCEGGGGEGGGGEGGGGEGGGRREKRRAPSPSHRAWRQVASRTSRSTCLSLSAQCNEEEVAWVGRRPGNRAVWPASLAASGSVQGGRGNADRACAPR